MSIAKYKISSLVIMALALVVLAGLVILGVNYFQKDQDVEPTTQEVEAEKRFNDKFLIEQVEYKVLDGENAGSVITGFITNQDSIEHSEILVLATIVKEDDTQYQIVSPLEQLMAGEKKDFSIMTPEKIENHKSVQVEIESAK